MELEKLVEIVKQSKLPFVYSGEKLNDEKCQKALKKIGADSNVLAVITTDALFGLEGLAILKTGIKFSLFSGSTGTHNIPKTKGEYPFDNFIVHDVTVKKGLLPKFDVSMVFWDNRKKKSFTFQFGLTEDNVTLDDAMKEELENILKCLVTKTGTEYVEETVTETDTAEAVSPKDPNTFDFVYNEIHTIIILDEKNVVIKKLKVDEKTKIQTPKESPVTIPRSAIASVTNGTAFSPLTFLKCIGLGIGFFLFLWLLIHFWVGFVVFVIFTVATLPLSFPMTLIIKRKDGQRFTTRFLGSEKDNVDYERFINTIFQ